MATKIDTLVYEVTADVRDMQRQFQNAERTVKQSTQSVTRTLGTIDTATAKASQAIQGMGRAASGASPAIKKVDVDLDRLKVSATAASRSVDVFEAQMRQAASASTAMVPATNQAVVGVGRVGGAMSRLGPSVQNASFQLQDIIVQLQGGATASRALGQQLPQLLGGFGPMGAVIGLAAGALAAFSPMIIDLVSDAEDAEEAVRDLSDVMEDLQEETREAALEAERLNRGLNSVAQTEAVLRLEEITQQIKTLREEAETVEPGKAVSQSERAAKQFVEIERARIAGEIEELQAERERIQEQLDKFQTAQRKLEQAEDTEERREARKERIEDTEKYVEELEKEILKLQQEREVLDAAASARQALTTEQAVYNAQLKAGIDFTDGLTQAEAQLAGQVRDLVEQREKLRRENALSQREQSLRDEADKNRLILQYRGEETEELRIQLRLLELKRDLGEDAARELEDEVRTIENQNTRIERQRELYRENQQVIEGISRELSDAFISAFDETEDGFDSLIESMEQRLKRFAAELLQEQFIMPIFAQIIGAGGVGGVGGGVGSSVAGAAGQVAGAGGTLSGAGTLAGAGLASSGLGGLGGVGNLVGGALLANALISGQSFTAGSAAVGGIFNNVGTSLFGSTPIGHPGLMQSQNITFTNAGMQFSSPAGIAGGLVGSIGGGFASDALGIEQNLGGTIGGTIGSIAGSFIPIPFVGTAIGSFAGSVLGNLIGGLFGGGGVSQDVAGGQAGLIASGGRFVSGNPQTAFGGSAGQPLGIIDAAANTLNAISDEIGINLANALVPSLQGGSGVAQVFVGGTEGDGPAPLRAFAGVGNTTRLSGSPEDIAKGLVLETLRAADSFFREDAVPAALIAAMEEAANFDELIENLDTFIATRDRLESVLSDAAPDFVETIASQAREEIAQLSQSIEEFVQQVESYGLSVDRANEIAANHVREVFGINDNSEESLSEVERQLAMLEARFEAAAELFEELGISAAEAAAGLENAKTQLREGFEQGIQDQILAITDPLQLALEELERQQEERLNNAEAIGADIVEVERLHALERQQVIERFANQTANSLQDFLDEITFGGLSGASPQATLAGTEAAFEAAAAQALSGDVSARARIQELGQSFIEASRAFFASGGGFQSDLSRVQDVVSQLIADAPGFAHGTMSAPSGLAIVGEQGAELVQFRGGEQVIPANTDQIVGALNNVGGEIVRGNASTVNELRALRKQVESQGEELARLRRTMRDKAA